MREILFKAKRIDNGEWVEGCLVFNEFCSTAYPQIGYMHTCKYVFCEVNPDTICQYTGLTDKNGCKIWENDILIAREPYSPSEKFYLKYDNEVISFVGIYIGFEKIFHVYKGVLENCEIIGNIFDNKELLEN